MIFEAAMNQTLSHPNIPITVPAPSVTRLTEACAAFHSRCDSLNLASGTVAWYDQILRDLTRFLESRGVAVLGQVQPARLRDYLSHLRQRELSSETVFRVWGALKAFFGFLGRERLIGDNPMATVERPRRERHLIEPLNMVQVRALLEQPNLKKRQGLRDRAMMLLMVDSGLRLSEVLGLEIRRVHWQEKLVTVLGKGRKERTVPLGHNSASALDAYLQARGAGGVFAFPGRTGKPLDTRVVQLAMKRYGKSAAIDGVRVSPHTLRHTFAIQYVRNGGDPFSLQAILGHSTLDMVRNYVNLASRDVSEQHRKFSPMDRLLGCPESKQFQRRLVIRREALPGSL